MFESEVPPRFQELSKTLETSNKKSVLRDGVGVEIPDREIVVGDVVQFNAHNQCRCFCGNSLFLH